MTEEIIEIIEEIIKILEDCVDDDMVYENLSYSGRKNFEKYDFTVGKLMNMLKKFPEDMKICLGGDESIYEIPYDKLKIKIEPTKNKNLLQIAIEGFWTDDNEIT